MGRRCVMMASSTPPQAAAGLFDPFTLIDPIAHLDPTPYTTNREARACVEGGINATIRKWGLSWITARSHDTDRNIQFVSDQLLGFLICTPIRQ